MSAILGIRSSAHAPIVAMLAPRGTAFPSRIIFFSIISKRLHFIIKKKNDIFFKSLFMVRCDVDLKAAASHVSVSIEWWTSRHVGTRECWCHVIDGGKNIQSLTGKRVESRKEALGSLEDRKMETCPPKGDPAIQGNKNPGESYQHGIRWSFPLHASNMKMKCTFWSTATIQPRSE